MLEGVADAVIESGRRLFVLIDEYDLFANELMLKDPAVYSRMVGDGTAAKTSSPISGLYMLLRRLPRTTSWSAFALCLWGSPRLRLPTHQARGLSQT